VRHHIYHKTLFAHRTKIIFHTHPQNGDFLLKYAKCISIMKHTYLLLPQSPTPGTFFTEMAVTQH